MKCSCDMKGFLSYLILWNLSKKSMNGAKIAKELEKRKGTKPSPGTIYPALKELKNACSFFCKTFYDMKEMSNCCK